MQPLRTGLPRNKGGIANHRWGPSYISFSKPTCLPPRGRWRSQRRKEVPWLVSIIGYQGALQFRPPNGKKLVLLPYYLYKHNRKTILWDIEPNSYPEVSSSSENMMKYVLANTKPGSIILLHVMNDSTGTSIGAIKGIAEGLKAKGYQFVTINELLSYNRVCSTTSKPVSKCDSTLKIIEYKRC